MNIVLFDPSEIGPALAPSDVRYRHIRKVLRRDVGDSFDVGEINGPRGKALITKSDGDGLHLQIDWAQPHQPGIAPRLAIGFPRPQTARDILRDATSIGVSELSFISTARSDPNYATSSLWRQGEWRRQAITGAAQAFDTFIPQVQWDESMVETLDRWSSENIRPVALDLYDCAERLTEHLNSRSGAPPDAVLIGPERGWDNDDRALLDSRQIPRLHLGPRVLRTETAVAVTLGILHAAGARA
ncbi:16S rRNA (uracil(1498)-N(3))-methyltransferase [Opitutaceae bacterium]|nr:16S rRNA (uracil(1498)-N(3))-methyltransferase [Opitutaceae bacterium]